MHLLVHWTEALPALLLPLPMARLIGGLRISQQCWRCSPWLTLPFWMKGLSHKLLFLLSFLTLYSQHNVIQSSLPILTNNRGTTLKTTALCSICAGNLISQTCIHVWEISWVLRRLLKPKNQTKLPIQVCRGKKNLFLKTNEENCKKLLQGGY